MPLSADDWQSLLLTLRLAAATTVTLVLLALPLSWWLARSRHPLRHVVEALVALPLVLPPTVIGFYLLLLFAGHGLNFTFTGLLIGSVLYSMPFVVQPLTQAFTAVGVRPLQLAAVLGAPPLQRWWRVAVPLVLPGLISAALLGFTHTLGEFGVVLMIGGNIPGVTRLVSIALYEHVETMQYADAHRLALCLLLLSVLLMTPVYVMLRRWQMRYLT
ncbi:MAG TPA: molybdate ABC transporter permease subunit [Stenotrophobium sp.]|jgi:molybdate transport system permease protein|nr:molybdate ABC transporter permease subunit [Stenotrophobium sp.]